MRKVMKKVFTVLLALVLIITSFGNVGVRKVNAASNDIKANVSFTAVSKNLTKGNLPKAATLKVGDKAYFNLAATENYYMKSVTLYVKEPGATKYTNKGTESAKGYLRYTYLPDKKYTFSKEGTYNYYWEIKYNTNYKGTTTPTKISGSVNVKGSQSNKKNTKQTISASVDNSSINVGNTAQVSVKNAKTSVKYTSSNSSIATVDSKGKVTGKKAGTVTITATAAGTEYYSSATAKVKVTVKAESKASYAYPMINYRETWGAKNGGTSWGANCKDYDRDNGGGRNYHIGIDLDGKDHKVYSFAEGVVYKTGWNSGNGNYIIIQHKISGKTVYSFYAHLKSESICVKKDQKVSCGTQIAVAGKTGKYAGDTIHLHFAVANKVSYSGGYYGYSTKFSGDKVWYGRYTFYNPKYVIKNGKLP